MLRAHLLILVLVALGAAAWAQPVNQTDAQGRRQGRWTKTYEDGKLRYEGQFKDGRPAGLFTYYYPDGKVEATNNHLPDGHTAAAHMYHPNGRIKAKGLYRDQKKDSLWQFFNDDQVLVLEETYARDVLNGVQRSYFPATGKPVEETHYTMGRRNGPWQRWYDNGKLWSKGSYTDDELDGDYEMNFPDGRPKMRGRYAQGMRTGVWLEFNDNGTVRTQTGFVAGVEKTVKRENGTFEEFYPSGITKSRVTYLKGRLHGPFTEWYDKGEFRHTTRPGKEGAPPEAVEELVGTVPRRKGEYREGQLHGPVELFREDGSTEKTEMYDRGTLIP
jgi:antitoxin component YwqK of YwqJK toxin-antitoxin module